MNTDFIKECEKDLAETFEELDDIAFFNQNKVLKAFNKNNIALRHFYGSTGYGYDDIGKIALNAVFADAFGAEGAVVSPLITCGTHALYLGLSSILRPNDVLLSVTGKPYDTMLECIFGKEGEDVGSLKDFGIKYREVELKNDKLDVDQILKSIKKYRPKVVYFQRSRGYSWRSPISVDVMADIFRKIREIDKAVYIFVDNCYGEFVERKEPCEVGADLVVGSLCKNPGAGIVPNGGYLVGTKRAIDLVERRMTAPSIGVEVGSSEIGYRLYFQGLFMAPSVVKGAIKGAFLLGRVLEKLGFTVLPNSKELAYDIIKSVKFNTKEELITFVQLVQKNSPVDGNAVLMPSPMPGYDDEVIMAAGTFVQGASIEMSCDSPIREPYVAYFQGGLTYEHIKLLAYNVYQTYKN